MGSIVSTAAHTQVAESRPASDDAQYLTFMLGGEMYAIGILNIKEIIEYGQPTEVPMMPDYVRGVINLRGRVVPVIDLLPRFGRSSTAVSKRTCIVIIDVEADAEGDAEGERQDIGVVVDSVSEVLQIAGSEIEPPPAFGAKIRADFIAGMGKINNRFVIILNVNRVLSVEELAVLTTAK